ncbi:MAG TPA: FlgD immunoglobulin-like domain containing protein [bacterium]|nr:FlgD immunoglobulin-like domain containing protein [bacterium]HPN45576.1 FlgD immunoglobulin-like domain containing protein [bacterium]
MNKRMHLFNLLLVCLIISTLALANEAPVFISNSRLQISIEKNGLWTPAGTLEFGKIFSTKTINLLIDNTGKVRVKITAPNSYPTHLDAISLGDNAPAAVYGLDNQPDSRLAKALNSDYDILDISGHAPVFEFNRTSGATTLSIRARIEPGKIDATPFNYPKENMYLESTSFNAFYSYTLNSNRGSITVNGVLGNETLGKPFFKEFSVTGSGHPSDYTYGWVRNDNENLYVAIDFVPDNSCDGDLDYTTVYIKNRAGLKSFTISELQQQWGRTGFGYTPRALYQHKVYEYQIPLTELGITEFPSDPLQLAFAAYGTATPLAKGQNIDSFDEPGGGVTVTVTSLSTNGSLADGAMYSTERDIHGVETGGGGPIVVSVNDASSDNLRFNSSGGGKGIASIVWDGNDNNYSSISFVNYVRYFGTTNDRISMLNVNNSGSASMDMMFKLYQDASNFLTSPVQTIPSGSGPVYKEFLISSFISTGTLTDLRAIELILNNTSYSSGADLSIDQITFSDAPLPVTLVSFYAEPLQEGILLHWKTASEANNLGFKIYRNDVDGSNENFSCISGLIGGHGSSSEAHEYAFVDRQVRQGSVYRYRLYQLDVNSGSENLYGEIIALAGAQAIQNTPVDFILHNNYPNPFNAETSIGFTIPAAADVNLSIYDINGKLVKTILHNQLPANSYQAKWDGTDELGQVVSSGVYFYKLIAGDYQEIRSLLLLK